MGFVQGRVWAMVSLSSMVPANRGDAYNRREGEGIIISATLMEDVLRVEKFPTGAGERNKGNHLNEQSERRNKGNIVKCVVDK